MPRKPPTGEWLPIDVLFMSERLTSSDIIRLCRVSLLPRIQITPNGAVWYHTSSLFDWELMLETAGFKSQFELEDEQKAEEANKAVKASAAVEARDAG